MAGNPKTSKSTAIKSVERPSTKGVKVGVNTKASTSSTAVVRGGKKK